MALLLKMISNYLPLITPYFRISAFQSFSFY